MWTTLTSDSVIEEFTGTEQQMLIAAQAGDKLPNIIGRTIEEVRGSISGGGYALGADGTIPSGLMSDAIAIARWRWLVAFPSLAKMQTKERQSTFTSALDKLKQISSQNFAPEPPITPMNPSGSWNSENKLIMRTHPIPPPSTQFQSTDSLGDAYANPNAPADGEIISSGN